MNAQVQSPDAFAGHWSEYRRVPAGPLVIGYREAGTGPALLLLHGIGSGSSSWQVVAALLAQRFRVIAWDAPGYGDSAALPMDEPSAKDYGDALHAFITALRLDACWVAGHSLGAMMAAAYAATHAEHLLGLLLANPAQGYASASTAERERVRGQRVRLLAELGPDGYAEQRAAAMLRPQASPEALAIVRDAMRRLRPGGFTQASWMLAHDDIRRYLPHWRGPLAMLGGDADVITPPAGVSALAAHAGAPCTLLQGAGHASYVDAPAAFAAALTEFTGGGVGGQEALA